MPTCSAHAVVDLDVTGPTISRHLYGHFAEHLGRCIYGGFWVGRGLADTRTRAASASTWSRLCARWTSRTCAGPAAASPTTTTGATASVPGRTGRRMVNYALGQRRGEQPLRHPRVHGAVRAARRRALRQRQRRLRDGAGDERVGRVPHPRRRPPDGRGCARPTAGTSRGRCRSGASATRHGAAAATCGPRRTPTSPGSYATFCRDHDGNTLYRIAAGAADDDYDGPRR